AESTQRRAACTRKAAGSAAEVLSKLRRLQFIPRDILFSRGLAPSRDAPQHDDRLDVFGVRKHGHRLRSTLESRQHFGNELSADTRCRSFRGRARFEALWRGTHECVSKFKVT